VVAASSLVGGVGLADAVVMDVVHPEVEVAAGCGGPGATLCAIAHTC
jgi:hypothetical protein